ncbi:hypothetical protein FB45DRAFT_948472 [Roridomyces roridus]|uniref:Uncharacterized protein n=1 Tax=Roridomyces roridus TaxID=1738132 RepID=A0AAD7F9V4_9AGAR|nr:hypothetical protein FB45DRAFT_948472 [Roridomyces roridus]
MPPRERELRTRIHELSSQIADQRQVLTNLEKELSITQGQLNTILDPFARFPRDISSAVLVLCLPEGGIPKPDFTAVPLLFLGFKLLVNFWIARAGNLPLRMSLHGELYALSPVIQSQLEARVRNLELYFPNKPESEWFQTPDLHAPFPFIETVTIGQENNPVSSSGWSVSQWYERDAWTCTRLLECFPNAVEFVLDKISFRTLPANLHNTSTHDNLKTLHLGRFVEGASFRVAGLLRHVNLPSLERLEIGYCQDEADLGHILAFLQRSPSPLRSFSLTFLTRLPIHDLSGLLPYVTELHLRCLSADADRDNFIVSLMSALSSSDMFWNLSSLTLRGRQPGNASTYQHVLNALYAWHASPRPPMRALQLLWGSESVDMALAPTPDVAAAIRDFVVAGMNIHVGPEGRSLI